MRRYIYFQEIADEFQCHENVSIIKVDVDVCDDVTEEFGITALPSFVILESMVHYNKKSTKNSILNTFIGKNSPTLVKSEVQSWLSYMDENETLNYDADRNESYAEYYDMTSQNTNGKLDVHPDINSLVGITPTKKVLRL